MPIVNPDEMGMTIKEAVRRLNASAEYRKLFYKVFRQKPNAINLATALSAFEETLETVDSRFDDWSNDLDSLSSSEERGRQLFIGKAACFDCHSMEDFTDDEFKNIGLYDEKRFRDKGRYLVTKKESDLGKFKTPGLRNVGVTAPYMHNGSFKTLEEVVDYYSNPRWQVPHAINMDTKMKKLIGLSKLERSDLVAFLNSLTDRVYRNTGLSKN
jgi:cytochrome c peroxidase